MLKVPNPCCIPLNICIKTAATISVVMALGVIIVQASMINSANHLHNASLRPLYKILRNEYYKWKGGIESAWAKLRHDKAMSSDKIEKSLRLQLEFNKEDGLEGILLKEKSIRENIELPELPDFAEIERVSYICGLNGLFGGILQMVSSFALLWSADKANKTVFKVWIAVTGGVVFSLATCLLAMLLQDNPVNLAHFTPSAEVVFSVLGINLILTLYFTWIVLAYLFYEQPIVLTRFV